MKIQPAAAMSLLLTHVSAALAAVDVTETDQAIDARCAVEASVGRPDRIDRAELMVRGFIAGSCAEKAKRARDRAIEQAKMKEEIDARMAAQQQRWDEESRLAAAKLEREEREQMARYAASRKFYYPEIRPYMEMSAQQLINRYDFFALFENRTPYTSAVAYVAHDACPVRDSANWGGEWKLGLIQVPGGSQLTCWSEVKGQRIRMCRVDFSEDPASWCENVPKSEFRQIPQI